MGGTFKAERFVVVDLETTSREPADAHVVEWAAIVVTPAWFDGNAVRDGFGGLVRPPVAIPPETSAVHHITDADVLEAPTWAQASPALATMLSHPGTVAVAHNAEYERKVLAPLDVPVPWLCTYKAALRVWPDAPGHSNETLRYWLQMPGTGRNAGQAPHSASHDALVTCGLLEELLKKAKLEDMLAWTNEPALLPTCPIGDWRGRKWAEVEASFLMWILRRITDRPDLVFCAQKELDRREEEYQQAQRARSSLAAATADGSGEDDDQPF